MIKSYEKSGKTEEEAIAAALAVLGLERDDVSVEILERAKSGFLGIGSSRAVVRINYAAPDDEKEQKAVEPEDKGSNDGNSEAEDGIIDTAKSFVIGLLERMGVRADIEVREKENGDIILNISGDGMGAVIGRRGETLDAIQHLANHVVNRGSDKRRHISVDAESYRARREESLVHLAEKMAGKAVKYKRSMALEPMNSYERHVIHTALQDYEGVSTSSTGTEPNRRVVVAYEKQKQNGSKAQSREWS